MQVVRNYGSLLIELSKVVPDGIVVFFPSYGFMKDLIVEWNQKGILEEILKHKLIFVETKDIAQTTNAMSHFRDACKSGRGAIFLSVARGKVAEGVDFKNYLGRCVVIIGIPFQYSKSKPLLCRMEYVEKKFGISNKDFLTFDAMRQCSQCLGRVIRSKADYGLMILADRRFSKEDKVEKLPEWICKRIEPGSRDMQLDVSIQKAKQFFRQMGQPVRLTEDLFVSRNEAIPDKIQFGRNSHPNN
jgi:DNA excision repair protein ERCC-2